MSENKETIKERTERLLKGTGEGTKMRDKEAVETLDNGFKPPEIPNSQKDGIGKEKVDRRKFNKRHPDSGRKPKIETLIERGIQQFVDSHINEEDAIPFKDRQTGKTIMLKKPRVVHVLEQLYRIGMGVSDKGEADALSKWLDRALGKAPQPIRGDPNDDTPVRLDVDVNSILDKAYDD